jgi:hypothetical protein
MISRDVVIGSDVDEHDGSKGQSATQQATVYTFHYQGSLIRLIDTPGIGDTRGIDQDRKNMANILSVLRNYAELHGVLILLKPNNARLGVMFRFCVKELLTHLHRSAAENMVFGFTNTRGSNYTPGDTFKPLENLLSEDNDVIRGLFRSNVYCFDSESFRYLAARKENIDMGNIEDYRRSWDQSAAETRRMLEHFQSLQPHHTQRTLSLNETRHLILQLTAPMQQISVAIKDTIAKNEQQVQELNDTQLTGAALKANLHIQKTTVKGKQLTKPKTVCAHDSCVKPIYDESTQTEVLLRKKLCHNPCCLTNVPVGRVGTPELVDCAAFDEGICNVCGHNWEEHEHILVEYSKFKETVVDADVQKELNTNGDMVKAKEAQIRALEKQINELKLEHQEIQKAAARFSLYLKSNSITHYNDATVEYLEHLIKDERRKLRACQDPVRLQSLEKDLDQYKKFVQAMEQGKKGNQSSRPLDEAGVAQLVQALYNLKHYGQMLKDLAQVVGRAYEASFRERPYRISSKKYWEDDGHTDLQKSRFSSIFTQKLGFARGRGDSSWLADFPTSGMNDNTIGLPPQNARTAAGALALSSISKATKNPFKSSGKMTEPSFALPAGSSNYCKSQLAHNQRRSVEMNGNNSLINFDFDSPAAHAFPVSESNASPQILSSQQPPNFDHFWPDAGIEERNMSVQVQSISNWDETALKSSAVPSTAPPPYTELPSGAAVPGPTPVRQTKGAWGRLKNKMRL